MTRTVNLPKPCIKVKCQAKSAGTQFTHMQSVPKTACQQIGTQTEIPRNINAASKSCYPSQTTKVSSDDRSLKIQSNHRCYKMQSPQKRSKNPRKIQSYSMWPVESWTQGEVTSFTSSKTTSTVKQI